VLAKRLSHGNQPAISRKEHEQALPLQAAPTIMMISRHMPGDDGDDTDSGLSLLLVPMLVLQLVLLLLLLLPLLPPLCRKNVVLIIFIFTC